MNKYAITGIALRFPQANSPQELFNNLLKGKTSFRHLTSKEYDKSPYRNDENFIPITSSIEHPLNFDKDFFNMSGLEAKITDPQQRIFLTCCYEAMEDASLFENSKQKIGVFASTAQSTYLLNQILAIKANSKKFDYSTFIGNVTDFNPTRVSYKLNLTGPSMAIQSGCSSSLVALNEACQNLHNNYCDAAIVGGVSIAFPLNSGYSYKNGSTFSKSGNIRPFDKDADGMVTGNGCGVIVIKELQKAKLNGDHIYAVISGIGITNDGNSKIGYTAPSVHGEKSAIQMALKNSNINPEDIDYIETHGTGTKLGDEIELRALDQAYNFHSPHQIGSLKSNIGHLDTASGIAGLIKAALILQHNKIPRSVNFNSPNPQLESSNLFIESHKNINLTPKRKHYVGVSSFGIGGTNMHVILENDLNSSSSKSYDKQDFVIQVSAKNTYSLQSFKSKLLNYLEQHTNLRIEDIARTLNYGRKEFKLKECYIANSTKDFIEKLKDSYTTNQHKSPNIVGKFISLPTYSFQEKLFILEDSTNFKNNTQTTNILETICNIWKSSLDEEVSENSDFFELDGDSLIAVDIIENINKVFNSKLSTEDLLNNPTPKKLTTKLKSLLKRNSANNVVNLRKGASNNKNLFLFHPAGGSTFCFKQLVDMMENHNYNIYAVSFPSNIKDTISLHDLAKFYLHETLSFQKNDSFLLGGYSFGGNIAIEVARQLESLGKNVNHVFLIDSLVPNAYPDSAPSDSEYLHLFPLAWNMMTDPQSKIDKLGEHSYDNIDSAIAHLRSLNKIPSSISDEKVNELFNIWINNHKALIHQNTEPINTNLTIFSAINSMPKIMYHSMHMNETTPFEWNNYSNGDIKIIPISGNHFTLMSDRNNLGKLARSFDKELDL